MGRTRLLCCHYCLRITIALLACQSAIATTRLMHNARRRGKASPQEDGRLAEVNSSVLTGPESPSSWHREIYSHVGVVDEGIFFPNSSNFGSTKVHRDWMYGFSAFWDPLREELRFFFDSLEDKARAMDRVLVMHLSSDKRMEDAVELKDCKLEMISDPVGRYDQHDPGKRTKEDVADFLEGWQLTCPGVSQEYRQAYLVYSGNKYTSFHIETIETERVGKIAACVGPLYTQRRVIKPFVLYSSRLGIEQFDIYHTLVSNFTVANPLMMGIWPSLELSQHEPLDLFSHPKVRWHSYEAPIHRYYHGQTTALNDCIVRNRYRFEFVVISDPDEIIRIVQVPSLDLAAVLDRHLPSTHGNLLIPRYLFPSQCCQGQLGDETQDTEETSAEFFESCKLHTSKDHDRGKSVVRPDLVEIVSQHIPILYHTDVQDPIVLDPSVAHMVHIRSNSAWFVPTDCELGHEDFTHD